MTWSNRPGIQDLLDWLAEDLVANGYDVKHTLEVMLTCRAYSCRRWTWARQRTRITSFAAPECAGSRRRNSAMPLGQLPGVLVSSKR